MNNPKEGNVDCVHDTFGFHLFKNQMDLNHKLNYLLHDPGVLVRCMGCFIAFNTPRAWMGPDDMLIISSDWSS